MRKKVFFSKLWGMDMAPFGQGVATPMDKDNKLNANSPSLGKVIFYVFNTSGSERLFFEFISIVQIQIKITDIWFEMWTFFQVCVIFVCNKICHLGKHRLMCL